MPTGGRSKRREVPRSAALKPAPIEQPVDIPVARRQLAGLLLAACALVAGSAWTLANGPGRIAASLLLVGMAFFGFCGLVLLRDLVRRGPVVSVSAHGYFDRRFSTDWIPWSSLAAFDAGTGPQGIAVLYPRPEFEDALPWTRRAKWTVRLNRIVFRMFDRRFHGGYWLPCQGVAGGCTAIGDAVVRVRSGGRRR